MDFVNPSRGRGRLNFGIGCFVVVAIIMASFVGYQQYKERHRSFATYSTAVEACDAYENGEDIVGALVTVVSNTDREGSYGGRRIFVNNKAETAIGNTVIVNLNSSRSVATASVVTVRITAVTSRDEGGSSIIEIYGDAS